MVLAKYNTSNISKFLDEIDKISIGLDPWFTSLNSSYTSSNYYPPYNILDMGEGKRRLEIAVAGFSKTEIEVYTEKNLLTVETNRTTKDEEKYYHNGIARRSFRRSWTLGDDVRVDDVNIVDGLLTVELSTIVPEHQRKKSYAIG